jgi:hypothetical protein
MAQLAAKHRFSEKQTTSGLSILGPAPPEAVLSYQVNSTNKRLMSGEVPVEKVSTGN